MYILIGDLARPAPQKKLSLPSFKASDEGNYLAAWLMKTVFSVKPMTNMFNRSLFIDKLPYISKHAIIR